MPTSRQGKPSKTVTAARARAQRDKLDALSQCSRQGEYQSEHPLRAKGKQRQKDLLSLRRARTTVALAIQDYLDDHEGGNHSKKTIQWHRIALTFFCRFLEEERGITLIGEVDASDISAWFTHVRKTPGSRGRPRGERTVQTSTLVQCAPFSLVSSPRND